MALRESTQLTTEIEAWEFLARQWDMGEGTYARDGLCSSISFLFFNGLIDLPMRQLMSSRINSFAPVHNWNGYRWPYGDREPRAQFCRDMVVRLKGEQ